LEYTPRRFPFRSRLRAYARFPGFGYTTRQWGTGKRGKCARQ